MQKVLAAEQFAELFEKAAVPIFVLDAESGRNLDFNSAAEEWTGYGRSELTAMSLLDLRRAEDRERTLAFLRHLVGRGLIETLEMTLLRKDGEERFAVLHSKAVESGGRRLLQVIVIDQTELRRAEAREKELASQLLKNERLSAIGQMAYGIGHELRNPLGAIQNAVYYVREALAGSALAKEDPALTEVLDLAEHEIDAAARILADLQEFSRPMRLQPRLQDLAELAARSLKALRVPPAVKIIESYDPALPKALVDPERLLRVFVHLAQNAFQAMPAGGELRVSTRLDAGLRQAGWARVEFKDSGHGMSPDVLAKIFEPLFSTKPKGAGLGLAVSLAYVRAHGGTIAASSVPGSGSVFAVNLPLGGPPHAG